MLSVNEINLLKSQNEGLKKQNKDLQKEVKELQKEVRLYDCINKWGTKECHCACRCLGNEFCQDADEKITQYKQIARVLTYPRIFTI